ncbi:hypothetical protein OF83DRAFT_1156684 [Amylostereum chailletii]|nr:hypothetical protein OF83DRAFT_1156684 [Amylostereum chailletii]
MPNGSVVTNSLSSSPVKISPASSKISSSSLSTLANALSFPRDDPMFNFLKANMRSVLFCPSLDDPTQALQPSPYPSYDDGQPVPIDELEAYDENHAWDKPFCFCSLRDPHVRSRTKLIVPKETSRVAINRGNPCLVCSLGSCPYFVNLKELRDRVAAHVGVTLPLKSFPLQIYTQDGNRKRLPNLKSDTSEPTPSPLGSQLAVVAKRHRFMTPVRNATPGPSSHCTLPAPPGILSDRDRESTYKDDMDDFFALQGNTVYSPILPFMGRYGLHRDGFIEDMSRLHERLPAHLSDKLRSEVPLLPYEQVVDLFHRMLRHGIFFEDFVQIISHCRECSRIMSANALENHICTPHSPRAPPESPHVVKQEPMAASERLPSPAVISISSTSPSPSLPTFTSLLKRSSSDVLLDAVDIKKSTKRRRINIPRPLPVGVEDLPRQGRARLPAPGKTAVLTTAMKAKGKGRAIDVIDLTASDDEQ